MEPQESDWTLLLIRWCRCCNVAVSSTVGMSLNSTFQTINGPLLVNNDCQQGRRGVWQDLKATSQYEASAPSVHVFIAAHLITQHLNRMDNHITESNLIWLAVNRYNPSLQLLEKIEQGSGSWTFSACEGGPGRGFKRLV